MTTRPDLVALAADLDAHLARVGREVDEIRSLAAAGEPDRTALWALAGHLQAFYTGCESILQRAVERFEGPPPAGADSHVRLLQMATLDLAGLRPPVLRTATATALDSYRAFRHFFRHGYGIDLDWNRMKEKVLRIDEVRGLLQEDLLAFGRFLRELAGGEPGR